MSRAAFVMCTALALACRAPAPEPAPQRVPPPTPTVERVPFVQTRVGTSVRVDWRVPQREGQLSDSQLVAAAPRIARLRAEPDTLRMDVTDSLPMATLVRVLAVDDSGAVVGEVRNYGFNFVGGLTIQPNGFVRARQAGVGVFGASLSPRLPGEFRSRGPASVIVVVSDSTGVGPRTTVARGSATISGVIRDSLGRALQGVSVQAARPDGRTAVTLARSVSDSEGRYRLESLPAGRTVVTAFQFGYQPAFVEVQLGEGAAEARDLRLRPGNPRGTDPRLSAPEMRPPR